MGQLVSDLFVLIRSYLCGRWSETGVPRRDPPRLREVRWSDLLRSARGRSAVRRGGGLRHPASALDGFLPRTGAELPRVARREDGGISRGRSSRRVYERPVRDHHPPRAATRREGGSFLASRRLCLPSGWAARCDCPGSRGVLRLRLTGRHPFCRTPWRAATCGRCWPSRSVVLPPWAVTSTSVTSAVTSRSVTTPAATA